jgi:hypothetical protein
VRVVISGDDELVRAGDVDDGVNENVDIAGVGNVVDVVAVFVVVVSGVVVAVDGTFVVTAGEAVLDVVSIDVALLVDVADVVDVSSVVSVSCDVTDTYVDRTVVSNVGVIDVVSSNVVVFAGNIDVKTCEVVVASNSVVTTGVVVTVNGAERVDKADMTVIDV